MERPLPFSLKFLKVKVIARVIQDYVRYHLCLGIDIYPYLYKCFLYTDLVGCERKYKNNKPESE